MKEYNNTYYSSNNVVMYTDEYTFSNNANGWKLICFNLVPKDKELKYFSHWFTDTFISNNNISTIDIISNNIQYKYKSEDSEWNKDDVEMPINIQISYYIRIRRSDAISETVINWVGYLIADITFDQIKTGENIYMSSFTSNNDGVTVDDNDTSIVGPDTGLIENSTFYKTDGSEYNSNKTISFNNYIKSIYTFTRGGMLIKQDLPTNHHLSNSFYNLRLNSRIGISVNMNKEGNGTDILNKIYIKVSNEERIKDVNDDILNNLNLDINISI